MNTRFAHFLILLMLALHDSDSILDCFFTKIRLKFRRHGSHRKKKSVTDIWISRVFLSKIPGGRWCNFISDMSL